jgi:hypothetical protein
MSERIVVIELTDPPSEPRDLGIEGLHPTWLDEDTLVYVARPPDWDGFCEGSEPEAYSSLHVFHLDTGAELVIEERINAGWRAPYLVASAVEDAVVYTVNGSPRCNAEALSIRIRDLASNRTTSVTWTTRGSGPEFPFGLLPSRRAFVIMAPTGETGNSRLYVQSFGASAERVADDIPADQLGPLLEGVVVGPLWPSCGGVSRLGPACEIYCRPHDEPQGWYRLRLTGGDVEPIDCPAVDGPYAIMDVHQR